MGLFGKAKQYSTLAISLKPSNWQVHYQKGIANQNLNNLKKAIKDYQNVIKLVTNEKEFKDKLELLIQSIKRHFKTKISENKDSEQNDEWEDESDSEGEMEEDDGESDDEIEYSYYDSDGKSESN